MAGDAGSAHGVWAGIGHFTVTERIALLEFPRLSEADSWTEVAKLMSVATGAELAASSLPLPG